MVRGMLVVALSVWLVGCSCSDNPEYGSLEQLLDPSSCAECHPDHHREWSGSMHAYAAEDPVFLAMNRRGQRETDGALGDFCVNCHAPVAVQLGLTTDGLNLDELPDSVKGVTCFYCHQVTAVQGRSNNPLVLAWDKIMRGGIQDPVPNTFHEGAYSKLHDRARLESADMCGACHDIVTPLGTHIERTYLEWEESLYAEDDVFRLSCSECHMRGRDGVAADYPGVPLRRVKDHSMPGVDLAITPFPERDTQRRLVQEELNRTLEASLCVADLTNQAGVFAADVILENIGAGHSFPSGAAADRRAWVEVVAYHEDEVVWSSGVVEEGEAIAKLDDPNLWLFRDTLLDADGNETHNFWDAVDYRSNLLRAPVLRDNAPCRELRIQEFVDTRSYLIPGVPVDRITMRVRVRAMGLDVLDDLISTGDLDPRFRDEIVTMDLEPTVLEWTPDAGVESGSYTCVPERPRVEPSCP